MTWKNSNPGYCPHCEEEYVLAVEPDEEERPDFYTHMCYIGKRKEAYPGYRFYHD